MERYFLTTLKAESLNARHWQIHTPSQGPREGSFLVPSSSRCSHQPVARQCSLQPLTRSSCGLLSACLYVISSYRTPVTGFRAHHDPLAECGPPPAFVNKVPLEYSQVHHSPTYHLCLSLRDKCGVPTETIWTQSLKYLLSGPLQKRLADLCITQWKMLLS